MRRKLKAANGEGSGSYNDERKRYEYKISYFDSESNRTKRKLFTSRNSLREAKEKAASFLGNIEAERETAPGISKNTTFGEMMKLMLDAKEGNIKTKTLERYQSHLRCDILPYKVADLPIYQIDLVAIQSHLKKLFEDGGKYADGLAPNSVNAVRRLFIQTFDYAQDLDLVTKNPARKTKPYKVVQKEIHALTHEEADKLINAARSFNRHAWIVIEIALGTGLRVGEIFGLEKANIDLENNKLRVTKTVVTTDKGILIQNSGKTKNAKRTVPLPEWTVRAIKRYQLWCKVQSLRLGYQYEKSPWLLSNPEGNPRSPSTFSGHHFKQCLELAGLPHSVRMHDLRHTHATWLLAAGVPVKVVSERLGHSSIRITLDIYAHVIESMQQEAVDALNDMFK